MSKDERRLSLTARILLAMALGLITGLALKYFLPDSVFVQSYITDGLFHIIGKIFIDSLKMLVVPLVFVSLVCGTCSLSDTTKLGRLGIKALGLYFLTTAFAVTLALVFSVLVGPGEGGNLQAVEYIPKEAPALKDVLFNLFPSNPIRAMVEGNMLQVIVFSILFGIAVALAGKSGEKIANLFNDLNEIIMKLIIILMNFAPYGVFCLMARLFATLGFNTIGNLITYFLLVLFVLILHGTATYTLMIKLLAGLNPFVFFRKMRPAMLFAFSTASSNATLPITLETATHRLGIRNTIASFTIPLGATINMDGTAIMQGVATVFIAQAYNIDLSFVQYLSVILTATLASIGTAGVPGVGIIMLAMVLQQVGLPVEGIALIIGVDRLLDMTRTAVNVAGDCVVSCIVAKSEGEFDQSAFDNPNAGQKYEGVHDHT
ncbi:MAG: dicarboxylate/amino acid:cation symporter [Deltaproteobacteria bacterium]|nr:dicarboxylate/amino acid:cation symporter [Deltaproteobacteria bacterium]